MLAAIEFDDQPRLEADEVENVAVERDLPLELEALKLSAPQRLPQLRLRRRGVAAHGAGEVAVAGWLTLAHGVRMREGGFVAILKSQGFRLSPCGRGRKISILAEN